MLAGHQSKLAEGRQQRRSTAAASAHPRPGPHRRLQLGCQPHGAGQRAAPAARSAAATAAAAWPAPKATAVRTPAPAKAACSAALEDCQLAAQGAVLQGGVAPVAAHLCSSRT